jgi:dephospho-CoA kinase
MFSKQYAIGLTGGIGSGKTTIANIFASLDVAIIDTDLIAHQLTAPEGAAIAAIRQEFGADFLQADGAMDRAKMRALVFAEPEQKRRLEAIVHPLIRAETVRQAQLALSPYLLIVIPLLVESGSRQHQLRRVLVVDCDEQTQIQRVMQRSQLSRQQVEAIMRNQASRAQRLQAANEVIVNEGDLNKITMLVHELHEKYLLLAAALQTNTKQHL